MISETLESNARHIFNRFDPEGKDYEPHREKTCLRGFQPDPAQTGLYNHI